MERPDLPFPKVMLFDWHGTLVNTHEAMYQAIEEMLSQVDELDLVRHLRPEAEAKTKEDEKLLRYIRIFRHLHPRVLAEQRISRTDIFDALFGENEEANAIAHHAYNECYRNHYGKVYPFQDGVYDYLCYLKKLGIKIGVVTNRSREFLDHELAHIDNGRWKNLFDTSLCGNEARRYKPAPDPLIEAIESLDESVGKEVWYVGDSLTDMITASKADITSIFYNGALWDAEWFEYTFSVVDHDKHRPDHIVHSFDDLIDQVEAAQGPIDSSLTAQRPARLAPLQPPPPREEPDWHPALAKLTYPRVVLFDWHATLVDTLDAMYHAVDDMLKELRELGLLDHLVEPDHCKSPDDMRLVEYVRDNLSLHPKIKLDRKISRTDIFEILFADNQAAKQLAHQGFTKHYRKYYGTALPFEPKVKQVLEGLRGLGLTVGVITNRDREFFVHELNTIDGDGWADLFDTDICGDDTVKRKPHPDQVFKAADNLDIPLGADVWYVGDSTTDVIAAKSAGITSVFFNGALWDQPWLNKIFPGNERYPHKPDVVVNDFSEFWAMMLSCRRKHHEKLATDESQ
ncbi:HAD-IA family hydrolase [Pontibacterium sp. N1Y112]|uniref:phosphoglycolate phosphatase n=1 Tax=Pontibacterium sinense TaxID=2781979 RepID=A0A8J7FTR4_9GAMM|nr:HAD-IA family hydrolase [Pontibacterium sinense]MBE9397170.1 HAD-IA family hydrolase [Pontibacterium sinense]